MPSYSWLLKKGECPSLTICPTRLASPGPAAAQITHSGLRNLEKESTATPQANVRRKQSCQGQWSVPDCRSVEIFCRSKGLVSAPPDHPFSDLTQQLTHKGLPWAPPSFTRYGYFHLIFRMTSDAGYSDFHGENLREVKGLPKVSTQARSEQATSDSWSQLALPAPFQKGDFTGSQSRRCPFLLLLACKICLPPTCLSWAFQSKESLPLSSMRQTFKCL